MKIKVRTSHGSFNARYDKNSQVWVVTSMPQYEEEIEGDYVTELEFPATATEEELAEAIDSIF